jgi:hypothetical protein
MPLVKLLFSCAIVNAARQFFSENDNLLRRTTEYREQRKAM